MDHYIGKILDSLERSNQIENTVIVFLSDNGGTINTYANNSPLRGWKYMFGEGGIRIPMIVAMQGRLPAGQQRSGIVSGMDVMPTVLQAVGLDPPGDLDGRSLLSIINGETAGDNHEYLCWSDGRGADVVRKGPWKLAMGAEWTHLNFKMQDGIAVRDPNEATYPGGTALFHLHDDPSETENVATKTPGSRSRAKIDLSRLAKADVGPDEREEEKTLEKRDF